jgi:hypothetical protein
MKNAKPPEFFLNLYRDLRDRRLLLPAIALVVGLLAVPIVLKHHADQGVAPPSDGVPASKASAAVPAVVKDELGVTDYRKRLDELQSKNPFHQQHVAPPPSADASAAPSASDSATSTSTSSTSTLSSGGSTDTSLPAGSTSSAPVSSSPSSSTPPPTSAPPDTSTSNPKPPKPTLYAFRVAIAIGEPGDLKRRENVSQGVVLPSKNKPMVAFVGATEDMSVATFVVADTIDDVQDGHCVPDRASCSLLQLKPGEEAHLHYAPQNRRYNLKLIGIRLAPVKKVSSDGQSPSQKGANKASVDSGLASVPMQIGYGSVK